MLAALLAGCAGTPDVPADAPPAPPAKAEAPRPEDAPFTACRRNEPGDADLIEETQVLLEETTCGAALWFDGLFGDGDLRTARKTHGRVEASVSHSQYEGTKVRLRFNVRAKFPQLEERVSAFAGRDDPDEFAQDRSEGLGLRSQFPRVEDQDEWLAGLGYGLPENRKYQADFRVGVRSVRATRAFAQWRFAYLAYADYDDVVQLRLTPFINTRDGFGVTAASDWSHALSPRLLARWGNIGTITEKSSGTDWRTALILYQNLRELRAIAYETFIRGLTSAPVDVSEYGVRTIYRHPLFEARLFAQLGLGYSWLRFDPLLEREGSAGVSAGFEMPFGAQPD